MYLHSIRLKKIAKLIQKHKNGEILADIGTDHAYLPCFLLTEGSISQAYACDAAKGPLGNSEETINKEHLQGKVIPLFGDGLDPISDKKTDMISICGMGGLLITEILNKHQEQLNNHLFILQANTAIDLLRSYLNKHHLEIIDEEMVKEGKHIYEMIIARQGKQILSDEDILFGPVLRRKKELLFIEKWQRQLNIQKKILKSLSDKHPKYLEVKTLAEMIEKELML